MFLEHVGDGRLPHAPPLALVIPHARPSYDVSSLSGHKLLQVEVSVSR
jgi:hypothetical protein